MTMEERFWRLVDKDGPALVAELGKCWVWNSCVNKLGYGLFGTIAGKNVFAHRFAMGLTERGQPGIVCHRCDNPPCVRPDHLWIGTKHDNSRDCAAKFRQRHFFGEQTRWAKLTADDARTILTRWRGGETPTRLAAEYSVSRRAIYNITSGQKWKHAITGCNVWEPA